MINRSWSRIGLFALASSLLAGHALGQQGVPPTRFQLNLTNPGARSLATGGAFLGLADDATAAFTNPAGLTNLQRPEISIEGRYFEFKNSFLDRGHSPGTASGRGVDTVAGAVFKESKDHRTDVSFASLVYPGNGWAVAVYRHELADFKSSSVSAGAFFDFSYRDNTGKTVMVTNRFFPVISTEQFKIVDYGASFALRLADGLTLGVGGFRSEIDLSSDLKRYGFGDLYEVPIYDDARRVSEEVDRGSDHDFVFNAGLLWKASRQFSVGAIYRKGPTFSIGLNSITFFPTQSTTTTLTSIKVPDTYGLGLTFRPTEFFTVSIDYDRVRWSQFSDKLSSANPFAPIVDLRSRDADEVRLGLQYVVPVGQSVLAFRAGAWRDPDHDLRTVGADPNPADDLNTAQTRAEAAALFPTGNTVYHYTAGVGVAIGKHYQLDLGADISKPVKTGSLSAVVRF